MKSSKKTKKTTSSKSGVESKIKPVKEVNTHGKFAFYGRSGTGKTTVFGTFPKPALIADVRDKGTKSVRNTPGVFVYPVTDWDDIEDLYWYILDNPTKYKSLSIDTTTQLVQLALRKVMGSRTGVVSRRAYGEAASLVNPWIILFRDLPLDIAFLAQEKLMGGDDFGDDEELTPEMGLMVMPSIAATINAAVDVIGNTFIREVSKKVKSKKGSKTVVTPEYCMRIGPHSRYLTKFRRDPSLGGEIPKIMVNPTYQKLMELALEED